MLILLQELEGYLRRNRSSQVARPSATLPKEFETFSPKIQTAIERISPTHVAEDVNNPEEAEIKEILLDPPKPAVTHANDASSSWGSKDIKEGPAEQLVMENDKVLISGMESNGSEPLSKFKPKQEPMELHPTDASSLSADISIVEKVRTHITREASQSETESSVRDFPMAFGHLKSDYTSEQEFPMNPRVVTQSESEDLADEPSIDSETPKLDHQEIAISQSNDTLSAIPANAEAHVAASSEAGEPEFEGLGSEPPMEFETFLMAQKESTHTFNVDFDEVEETSVNLSIHSQSIDDFDKEPALEPKNACLGSLDLGVAADAFQSDHSKAAVCHSNDGADKGSSDLEGNLTDPPFTDGAKMGHIFEPCEPTAKDFESNNPLDLDILRAEPNDAITFQVDGTPTLGSNIVDGDADDEQPTKMGTLQMVPSELTVSNSNKELKETSAEFSESYADTYDIEKATIPTVLDVCKPEVGVPQDEKAVDQTSGVLDPSPVDAEERPVDLPITEEAKIPISMDNPQSGIGGFFNAPPIESKKLAMDNSEPVMLQPKDTSHQDFLNDVGVRELETGLDVELPPEIKVDPSIAVISHSNEEGSKKSRELGESPAGLPAIEDVKISTTSTTCNPIVEGSWSPQTVEAVNSGTTGVKEGPMASSVIEELKNSVLMEAGQFDVEGIGNESVIEFDAFQSVHSESADHRTNGNLEKDPVEAELGISPSLGAQAEEVKRGNLVKAGNLPHSPPASTLASTSQKSSSEDLLKEAMQQYLNPELVAEVRQEDAAATPQSAFTECTPATSTIKRSANLDLETSESDDSLFNETTDSPKTAENLLSGEVMEEIFSEWAENQGVVREEKENEPKEGAFKKESFGSEEVYRGDVERDINNAEERTVSLKTEDSFHPNSTKCMEVGNENAFEVDAKPALDAKASQSDLEGVGNGFEASVKIEEGSFHLHDSTIKTEVTNVPTTDNRKENTSDEVGEAKSSVPHSTENLSPGKSHSPSSTLKNGDGKSVGESHQLTSEERMSITLDSTNTGDIRSSEKTLEQFEEPHIGKSVCMAKCDTFTEHSDDVLSHNTDRDVFGESNGCTTADGASGLTASGEENVEDVAYLDLKGIPESFDKPSASAQTEASKSSNFIAMSAKLILPDNEITDPVEFTDFVTPDVQCGFIESKASIEPENDAVAQKEIVDEATGYQNDVLGGEKAFEEPEFPLRGDENLGSVEVNLGSSQLSPTSCYKGKEAPDSILKQLSPPAVLVRDLRSEDEAPKLSEGIEDTDFLDPAFIKTEPHSGEFDSSRTIHIPLDRSPDTRPLEEGEPDATSSVGCEKGSDDSPRGEETESECFSGHLDANLHVTSGSRFSSCPPDSVHESECVALSGGEAGPVLQESLEGMASDLSEDASFNSSTAFDSKEKSANQPPDSTSLEESKLDAEDASWANFEGANSSQQIDEEKVSGCLASSPHEEPSATSWTVVELSETDKNSTTSERGERTSTHEPSELLYAGDSHLGSGGEVLADICFLPPGDEHFDSFRGEDKVVRGNRSDSKLSVNEEEKIKPPDANQMDPSDGGSIDYANWASFGVETEQTSGINDTKSDSKLLTGDSLPLSVLSDSLEPTGTLGKFDELLKKPLEDIHSFKDLTSGESAPKKDPKEPTLQVNFGAKERVEDTLIDASWNDLDQPEFDTKSVGAFAFQEGQFNEAEPISQSAEPEEEPADSGDLRFRTPWRNVDQLDDLENPFTETTGLEINTKSDKPAIGCKVDSNGSDEWEVDDWGTDSGCLQESPDQFHHTDFLGDVSSKCSNST